MRFVARLLTQDGAVFGWHQPARLGEWSGMSPDRVGFASGATGSRESQDHSKRLFWARP